MPKLTPIVSQATKMLTALGYAVLEDKYVFATIRAQDAARPAELWVLYDAAWLLRRASDTAYAADDLREALRDCEYYWPATRPKTIRRLAIGEPDDCMALTTLLKPGEVSIPFETATLAQFAELTASLAPQEPLPSLISLQALELMERYGHSKEDEASSDFPYVAFSSSYPISDSVIWIALDASAVKASMAASGAEMTNAVRWVHSQVEEGLTGATATQIVIWMVGSKQFQADNFDWLSTLELNFVFAQKRIVSLEDLETRLSMLPLIATEAQAPLELVNPDHLSFVHKTPTLTPTLICHKQRASDIERMIGAFSNTELQTFHAIAGALCRHDSRFRLDDDEGVGIVLNRSGQEMFLPLAFAANSEQQLANIAAAMTKAVHSSEDSRSIALQYVISGFDVGRKLAILEVVRWLVANAGVSVQIRDTTDVLRLAKRFAAPGAKNLNELFMP